MTEEQRKLAAVFIGTMTAPGVLNLAIVPSVVKAISAYMAEHDRMRQFIRNLADESRVYLESEEAKEGDA